MGQKDEELIKKRNKKDKAYYNFCCTSQSNIDINKLPSYKIVLIVEPCASLNISRFVLQPYNFGKLCNITKRLVLILW